MHKDHRTDHRGDQRRGAKAQEPGASSALSRRQFLGRVGGVTALTVAVGAGGGPTRLGSIGAKAEGEEVGPVTAEERREQAYDVRHQAALAHKERPLPKHPTNGDEERYASRIGNYSKALAHDDRGEMDLEAYEALLHAVATGEPAAFEAIPMGGTVALVNPMAMVAFVLAGADSHHLGMSAPPAFACLVNSLRPRSTWAGRWSCPSPLLVRGDDESAWKGFHTSLPIALRDRWASPPFGPRIWNMFSIIAEIRVFYVKLFGRMARAR